MLYRVIYVDRQGTVKRSALASERDAEMYARKLLFQGATATRLEPEDAQLRLPQNKKCCQGKVPIVLERMEHQRALLGGRHLE